MHQARSPVHVPSEMALPEDHGRQQGTIVTLDQGDRVAIVAPASQMRSADIDLLHGAVDLLRSWGLQVDVEVDPSHHFYMAGTDESRARHLVAALNDPAVKAIFCMRGGYGSLRLIPFLEAAFQPTPKVLAGFSDFTTLHLASAGLWPHVQALHAPNVATRQLLSDEPEAEQNRTALRASLFDSGYSLGEDVEMLREGSCAGPLIGGCLSLVTAALGTRYAVDAAGCVLFLEDVGEAPFRVDRMLTQLRLAGTFDRVAGVVFGEMHNCADPYNDIRKVVLDAIGNGDFPVAFGLKSGHGKTNLALPIGRTARIDGVEQRFSLGNSRG